MEQENTSTTTEPRSLEVVRPHEGRMIAGVAKGLANRLDIADWIVRVAFIVTAFMGLTGVVAYLACWALIRDEADEEPPASRFFARASTGQAWIGVGLIVTAVMVLLMIMAVRWTFAPASPGVIWAGLLLLLGVLLYTGQLRLPIDQKPDPEKSPGDNKEGVQQVISNTEPAGSPTGTTLLTGPGEIEPPPPVGKAPKPPKPPKPPRERSPLGRITIGVMILALGVLAAIDISGSAWFDPQPRHYLALATTVLGLGLLVGALWGRARWLLLVAVVVIPALLVSPFSTYWQSQGTWVGPTQFSELQPSYHLNTGRITISLDQLPWDGQVVDLRVDAEVGEIVVMVPFDVAVSGSASVNVGRVNTPSGSGGWGIGPRTVDFDHPGYTDTYWGDGTIRGNVNIISSIEVGSIRIFHSFFERNPQ